MVNKIILTSAIFALSYGVVFAQDAGVEQPQQPQEAQEAPKQAENQNDAGSLSFLAELDAQAETTSNAEDSANKYLAEKGWCEGLNEKDGRYVAIGSSGIKGSPSDKNFQDYRVNAYTKAMLDAKSNITKFFAQEISTRAALSITEPMSAAALEKEAEEKAQVPPTILQKVKTLIHKKLDKELAKEGVSYDSPKAKKAIEDLNHHESFANIVLSLSKTQVGGLVTSKIFEQDGKIVVVAYYSDKTKILAGAMNGTGAIPKVKARKGDPVGVWVKKLKKSQLYPSMGIQLTSDKDGNIVILSYGQARARSSSHTSIKMGYSKAEKNADGYIRNFAGETVAYAGQMASLEDSKEFVDGTSVSNIESMTDEIIQTEAKALNFSGIQTIHKWSIPDRRSGETICGVVRMWSLKTSDSANISREQMKDATINRGVHMKAKPTASGSASKSAGEQSSSNTSIINGDTSKYKAQSIESEDF